MKESLRRPGGNGLPGPSDQG